MIDRTNLHWLDHLTTRSSKPYDIDERVDRLFIDNTLQANTYLLSKRQHIRRTKPQKKIQWSKILLPLISIAVVFGLLLTTLPVFYGGGDFDINISIEPTDPMEGDLIFINATIPAYYNITQAWANISGINMVNLTLMDNSTTDHFWQGTWILHNLSAGDHLINISAIDYNQTLYYTLYQWTITSNISDNESIVDNTTTPSDQNDTDITTNESMINETTDLLDNDTFIQENKTYIRTTHESIINQPVRWTKEITFENKHNETKEFVQDISIPAYAEELTIVDENGTVIDERIQVNHTEKTLSEYKLEEDIISFVSGEKTIDLTSTILLEINETVEPNETKSFFVHYITPGPVATETIISPLRKQVTISSDIHYTNISAYTDIENRPQHAIHLYHVINDARIEVDFTVIDLDNDTFIDRIEWIVPSLSDQIYEIIIEITKAEHLDENRTFIADIYDEVKAKDDVWCEPINDQEYVRVTFEKALDNSNDITIFARSNGIAEIEVYTMDNDTLVTKFDSISGESWYKIYLTSLDGDHAVFDLRTIGDFVEYDYIVDPAPQISDPYPANGSTDIPLNTTLNITINDADGDLMNITWYSNSSGSWLPFYTGGLNNTSEYTYGFEVGESWNGASGTGVNGTSGPPHSGSRYYSLNNQDYFLRPLTIGSHSILNVSYWVYGYGINATTNLTLRYCDGTSWHDLRTINSGVINNYFWYHFYDEINSDSYTFSDNSKICWNTSSSSSRYFRLDDITITYGYLHNLSNGTYCSRSNSNFSASQTKYWWSVNCTDGTSWTNGTYSFTTLDTPPSITINFAGNLSDSSGPYYVPMTSTVAADGFYVNDSHQSEDGIYINCTVTDDAGVDEVWLHWLNETTWTNNSYQFTNSGGNYYEFNSSGNITDIASGYNYSFDIWANDTSVDHNSTRAWQKRNAGGVDSYSRSYVQLAGTPTNASFTSYYLYEADYTYLVGYGPGHSIYNDDVLHHDQGPDGWGADTGYLLDDIPTSAVHSRNADIYVDYWFDESVTAQKDTMDNVYFHVWWYDDNPSQNINFSIGKSQAGIYRNNNWLNYYMTNDANSRSNITYSSKLYNLETSLLNITSSVNISDNEIYEYFIMVYRPYPLHNIQTISNRSFTSFILFNVPDNTTLQGQDTDSDSLNDYNELYVTFTNPFLSDTDNDGINDYWENQSGSDPNNYTETFNFSVEPSISFDTPPTPANNSQRTQNWVQVNVTVSDPSNTSSFIDWDKSLAGYWNFYEGSGTTAHDNSTHSHNGTLYNMVDGDWVTGKFGTALNFKDATDYINIGPTNDVIGDNCQEVTISAWIKSTDASSQYPVSFKRSAAHSTLISLNLNNNGDLGFLTRNYADTAHDWIWATDKDYGDGEWHHIVATVDGMVRTLYIDGELKDSDNDQGMQNVSGNTAYACIGAFSSNNIPFNGLMDEVQVWTRALSYEEVNASYNSKVNKLYHNFTGLSSANYSYYAHAIDAEGNENTTETRNVTINTKPTISLISPSPNGTSGIGLQPTCSIWANDTGGDTLTVYWYENTTGPWILRQTNNSVAANSEVDWTFSQASAYNTTYYWMVAVNDSVSNVTVQYYFTTVTETVPYPPSSFIVTSYNETQINLTWSKGTRADYTRIQQKTGSYPVSISDGTNVYNGTGTSCNDGSLSETVTYYYRAWSWNETNNEWSANYTSGSNTTLSVKPSISFDTPPTPANNSQRAQNWVQVNVSISDISDTSAFFDWNGSLRGYWSMEYYNSTGVYDNSTYDNFGTFGPNGPSSSNITTGKYGNALEFDGDNDYIDTSLEYDLSGNGAFSVFAWVKDIPSGSMYVICQAHDLSSYSSDWILGYQNNGLWFRGTTIDGGNQLGDGDWHHFGFTFDGTDARLFIDGSQHGSSITPAGYGAVGTVKLMTRGDAASGFVSGSLDEVCIFSRALSQEETNASYNSKVNQLYHNFTGLSPANYSYYAHAIDTAGNENTTETRYFEVLAENISINVTPPEWNQGSVNIGDTNETAGFYFNLTNEGNVALDITVNATHAKNTTSGAQWNLTTTPAHDNFSLQYNKSGGGSWSNITITFDTFITNLAIGGYQTFDLKLLMATTSSTVDPMDVTVTFKSVAS